MRLSHCCPWTATASTVNHGSCCSPARHCRWTPTTHPFTRSSLKYSGCRSTPLAIPLTASPRRGPRASPSTSLSAHVRRLHHIPPTFNRRRLSGITLRTLQVSCSSSRLCYQALSGRLQLVRHPTARRCRTRVVSDVLLDVDIYKCRADCCGHQVHCRFPKQEAA